MASGGYPARYDTGFEITGLDATDENSLIFHAGTRLIQGGGQRRTVTSGGRVLTVVGRGNSLAEARQRAYHRVRLVSFHNAVYRTDIGLAREPETAWQPDSVRLPG